MPINTDSLIDTLHGFSEDLYDSSATASNIDYGQVNELTTEELKKKRNRQLFITISIVILIAGGIFAYKKFNK